MNIWVDADACPLPIKQILYRAAERAQILTTLVANQPLAVPRSKFVRAIQVGRGFDVADNEISRRVQAGDLVVTADIPLAADVIGRGAQALNPRGELYSADNVRERLAMRDLLEKLRETGVQTQGPAPLDHADRKRFADALDRLLAKRPA
jgi:uncharacterized protein